VGDSEFIIVIRSDSTSSRYTVYLVPTGSDQRNLHREYIRSADTLWGAKRAIRKERKRLALGARIVHREAL
jgi:hypothetical protein